MNDDPVLEIRVVSQSGLETEVQLAKTDKHALSTLLHDYMPFIKKCVSGVFFKGQSKEDNLTDAMLAFTHSVQTYNPEHGAFIKYAAVVIRNRLVDNARKEIAAQKHLFSLSGNLDEKNIMWEADTAQQVYNRAEEENNLRVEIDLINSEFSKWGFSWVTLLKNCPKQERSRRICQRIARSVRGNSELLAGMQKTHQVPVTRLSETFPRKALEKYRQYIAALVILSQGDYPYIESFVPQFLSGEENK
ncbi:hypothetical protein FACS1894102_6060 [Spirochaetia bacterium]|nr:hypothetical protein FACS1894102_6060 [Spirochaetia bacterium]